MNARNRPLALAVAVATLIEALIGVAMALEWVSPEVGGSVTVAVTAALAVVQRVVTPVAKVARVLDKPVEVVDRLLERVTL